jgi:copper homeostasis protein
MSVTFHRAFDVCRDPFLALGQLADLGVDRILTSGQEATAVEGLDLIAEFVRAAGDRISILACGNINERNIKKVVASTCVSEAHFTAFGETASEMRYRNDRVFMGGTLRPPEYSWAITDADKVRAAIDAV